MLIKPDGTQVPTPPPMPPPVMPPPATHQLVPVVQPGVQPVVQPAMPQANMSCGSAHVMSASTMSSLSSYTGATSYTYSSASPYGSTSSTGFHRADLGGFPLPAQALYAIQTEGPTAAQKKKKRKKKKVKSDKLVVSKEEQEEERDRAQKELEAQVELPEEGDLVVDDSKKYLQDCGPKQIIINYLPQELSEEEFRSLFEQYGPVEAARFVSDKHSGKSKGYGFVYYYFSAHARAAIRHMNGFELYGKYLRVSYAVPQRPNPTALEEEEEEAVGKEEKNPEAKECEESSSDDDNE